MALVSARPASTVSNKKTESAQQDLDLARVETLLRLHQTVKLAYSSGSRPGNLSDEFRELHQARAQVHSIVQQLSTVPSLEKSTVENDDDDETEAWS